MIKGRINYFEAMQKLGKTLRSDLPVRMAIAANRVRSRMMNSMAKRRYSSKGKKPAPSPPGTPPHTIGQKGEGAAASGKPKTFYPMRQVRYEKIAPLKYAVGVAPFLSGGSRIMAVPRLHEVGGAETRTRNVYHGNPFGHRHKISRKAKDAYLRKMRRAFATNDTVTLRRLGIWKETKTAHYPRRPYLEPAARKAAQELPSLFTFAAHVY